MPRPKTLEELQQEMWGGAPLFGDSMLGGPTLPAGEEPKKKFRLIPLTDVEEQAAFRSVLQNDRVRKLQQSFLTNAGGNPDQVAQMLHMSEVSGFPVWMLDHEGDAKQQAEQAVLLRRSFIDDWSSFLSDNPSTARFLSDDIAMSIAYDDIPDETRKRLSAYWESNRVLYRGVARRGSANGAGGPRRTA